MRKLLTSLLAPHYCCSCGAIGTLLCDYCKYNIINEPFEACMLCHKLAPAPQNLCRSCNPPFAKAWCAGSRSEGLKRLVNNYKFERARAAYVPLADLLHTTLPTVPSDTVVVPIPTIAPHVRERGYDQAALLARRFAYLRGLPAATVLRRKTNSVQRGATRKQRAEQAARAFTAAKRCSGRYLVVDDITTTGATLRAAAQVLLDAGASEVWVAVVAVQPIEK